jgi:hypothetical protein
LLLLSIGWKNVVSQCKPVSTSKYPDGNILLNCLNASSRVILKGNYGAGTVIVWDIGSYSTDED